MSVALSLALHGLALVPLLFAGTSGSTPSEEPALLVELALAAPAPQGAAEPEAVIDVPTPEAPPPVQTTDIKPVEPPPPVEVSELKAADPPPPPKPAPPQPQPQPKPKPKAAPRAPQPASDVTQTVAPPDTGTAEITQTASAATSAIVWEHHPRFRVPPRPAVYPPRARDLGQQGEALVRVRLAPDGSAAEILLWRGSGFELLDRAALVAVRGWQFMPAIRNGHAVTAWVEIPVRFHLR
ncbi:MAG: energy transducer TonB [Proteobacteria bacterium]|nr:energy transducer TonB [Pseudomonadota bacterium]